MSTQQRKSTEQRRGEIADAVLRVIGEQGVGALTTANLAAAVGLSTGALFRHFATLEDIMREAVRLAIFRIDETFPDPQLPPLRRLFALAENRVRLLGAEPGLAWLLRSEDASLAIPEDSSVELRAVVSRSRKFILEAIRDGAADGSIRSDIAPEALLVIISGTIHALIGLPGAHRIRRGASPKKSEPVFAALRLLLVP